MSKSKRKKSKLTLIREPNGRRSRSAEAKEFAPTLIRRLRDAAVASMEKQEWGTALGRLFLLNEIDGACYEAGKRWAERALCYHSAIGGPPPVHAAPIEPGSKGSSPDPDSASGRDVVRQDYGAVINFLAAHAVLAAAGKRAEKCVRNLCEDDENPAGAEDLAAAQKGLLWLAQFWNLTANPKTR